MQFVIETCQSLQGAHFSNATETFGPAFTEEAMSFSQRVSEPL